MEPSASSSACQSHSELEKDSVGTSSAHQGAPTTRGITATDEDRLSGPIGTPTLRSREGGVLRHAHADGRRFKGLLES